jgi:hypothetical protein
MMSQVSLIALTRLSQRLMRRLGYETGASPSLMRRGTVDPNRAGARVLLTCTAPLFRRQSSEAWSRWMSLSLLAFADRLMLSILIARQV